MNRRNFLQLSGLGSLPVVSGGWSGLAGALGEEEARQAGKLPEGAVPVSFARDGPGFTPTEYLARLQEINRVTPIEADFYTEHGTVDTLLKKFMEITGKEAAFYMPSGTLANQLAIQVLSKENTKVFVQETSHVFRDEGDAAQSVYGKRLIPLAKGSYAFTLAELQAEIEYANKGEVFATGIGAVSIEIPVRRCNFQVFPIEELKKISAWCREKGYKLHLDGARLHLASTWSGVSVREYAALFDTVYMCLYKYLGASSGAILCGSKEVIAPMEHLVKVHGGSMYQNWSNAAMALHQLDGLEQRLVTTREKAGRLFQALNTIPGIQVHTLPEGCNVYHLRLEKGYDGERLAKMLAEKENIRMPTPDPTDGAIHLHVNESLLLRENESIIAAFKAAVPKVKA
jgi:threonine aldolase